MLIQLFTSLLLKTITFLVNTPLYPHWLMHRKMKQGNTYILKNLYGKVLEVGAGDASRKNQLLKLHKKIKQYTTTDCASWDTEFNNIDKNISRFGELSEIIFGYKKRGKLDFVCDAMDLPFKNNSFDFHISFEVLEHISNPFNFFNDATRVIKKGGRIILSVPVLFRVHGIEPDHYQDYFRYMPGFFHEIAQINNLKIVKMYSNTGLGTTVTEMINQWIILRIMEGNFFRKIVFFTIALVIFPTINIIGYFIDIHPDTRFSTRYHIILEK